MAAADPAAVNPILHPAAVEAVLILRQVAVEVPILRPVAEEAALILRQEEEVLILPLAAADLPEETKAPATMVTVNIFN